MSPVPLAAAAVPLRMVISTAGNSYVACAMPSMQRYVGAGTLPKLIVMPSGTSKTLKPAPSAAASDVSTSLHGLAMPTDAELSGALVDDALAGADAALADAELDDAD